MVFKYQYLLNPAKYQQFLYFMPKTGGYMP